MNELNLNLDLNSLSEFLITNFPGALDFLHRDIDVFRHNGVFINEVRELIKGRDVIVYGSGPTLNYFDPKIITSEKTLQMGVNSQIINEKLKLDFFFAGDYVPLKKNNITPEVLIEKKNAGMKICLTRKYGVNENDGKTHKTHIPDSFVNRLPDDINILYYTNSFKQAIQRHYTRLLFSSCSIGQVPLQISMFCGARRIYLVGFDQGGSFYADGRIRISYENQDSESPVDVEADSHKKKFVSDEKAIRAFTQVREMKKKLDYKSEIISVNPVNMKGIFDRDVYTKEYADSKGLTGDEYKILTTI